MFELLTAHEPPEMVGEPISIPRGGVSLLAAAPGVGKSWLGMQWALSVPDTLYLAWDMSPATFSYRLGKLGGEQVCPWVSWDGLDEALDMWQHVFGTMPQGMVVDNLANLAQSGEWESEEASVRTLARLARKHNIAVLALHHVTSKYVEGDEPVPLSGVRGQLGRFPEVMFTADGRDGEDIHIQSVKDRHRKCGEKWVPRVPRR